MTTALDLQLRRAIQRASLAAVRAPSVFASQPWRIVRRRKAIEVHADRTRHFAAMDPDERQLVLSCGRAVANAALALTAGGFAVEVARRPDPGRRDLLAEIRPRFGAAAAEMAVAARLLQAVDLAANGRPSLPEVPRRFAETAQVRAVPRDRVPTVQAIATRAEDLLGNDLSALAELRDVRSRLPHGAGAGRAASLGVVFGEGDSPADWLSSGERLQRLALELALDGAAVVPHYAVTSYGETREALGEALALPGSVHVLFGVLRATGGVAPRRRRLVDTLIDAD